MEVRLNELGYWINGELFETDPRFVPFIVDGRTFVYIDYIVEGLGLTLHWDSPTRTISITD